MHPRIEMLSQKTLVGYHITMSFANNKTPDLWRTFMPRRGEIQHIASTDLYSLEVYPSHFFEPFKPDALFEKWAAIEVIGEGAIPDGMEIITLNNGLYAVFQYKGLASAAAPFYQSIFGEWLPQSGFSLDNRPHFALMGDKYRNNDPESEEEIWIPISRKDVEI